MHIAETTDKAKVHLKEVIDLTEELSKSDKDFSISMEDDSLFLDCAAEEEQ